MSTGFNPEESLLEAALGAQVTLKRIVSESDILLFAMLSGDFHANHVDETLMAKTKYGERIAHGALLVAYASQASTAIAKYCGILNESHYPVSTGYDRIRLIKAAKIGDELSIQYRMTGIDELKSRTVADVKMVNQQSEVCFSATHIMTWLKR